MRASEQSAGRGFRPLHRLDGYLPIRDYGLIGDGRAAALIGRDGIITWMCIPRFDSPPVFCGILDAVGGGSFSATPEELFESRQEYLEDTGVLVTEMRTSTGLVRLTDAMLLRAGADLREDVSACRGELLRKIDVPQGRVRMRVALSPRGGCVVEPHLGGIRIRVLQQPRLTLALWTSRGFPGTEASWELGAGDAVALMLVWERVHRARDLTSADHYLAETIRAWRSWATHLRYGGPEKVLVRRSAITLKLLDHFENGAIVAAPTSSLPEAVGGARNWDYRYAWIRDAALSVYALRRIGMGCEASGFLAWALIAIERHRPLPVGRMWAQRQSPRSRNGRGA
jgi:GH15 family glucan-1,4-alpha-glucosidase